MRKKTSWAVGLLLFIAGELSLNAGQATIDYNGRLTNQNGQPITDTVLVKFTICKGGDPSQPCVVPDEVVCSPTAIAVTPDSTGGFRQQIGPCESSSLLTPDPLFLQITINDSETLLPRKQLMLGQDTASSASFALSSAVEPVSLGLQSVGRIEVPSGFATSGFGKQVIQANNAVPPGSSVTGSFRIENGESGLLSIKGTTGGNVTHIFRIAAIGASATDNSVVNISNANTTGGGNCGTTTINVSNEADFSHVVTVTLTNCAGGTLNLNLNAYWMKIH